MEMDKKGWTPAAVRLLAEVEEIDRIPPRDMEKGYSRSSQRYITGENTSVVLSELQANLCKAIADEPDGPRWKAYVRAGYDYTSYFNEAGTRKRIKAHLTGMANQRMNPKLTSYMNYLKYGAAEELKIDATWILNESVNLFETCKSEKKYTQAIRLLESISTHVDVDAKVSNRLVVEGAVDYAAILNSAENRIGIEEVVEEAVVTEMKQLTEHKEKIETKIGIEIGIENSGEVK